MRKMRARFAGLGLFFLSFAFVFGINKPSLSQGPRLAFDQIVGHPRGLPQLPPQGAWGEVINATPRWLVIQNHTGQQYPIALEDIGEFLVRWPSSLDQHGAESMVEAVGNDLGSNVVEVTHVDVFEGNDRTLVAPTYNSVLANNMPVTAIDPGVQSVHERLGLRRPEHALRVGLSHHQRGQRHLDAPSCRGQRGTAITAAVGRSRK